MKKLFHTSALASKLTIVALALTVLGVVAVGGFNSKPVSAQAAVQDCSANSIIKCGVTSASDLVTKATANNPPDLQAIYTKFNLSPDRYADFTSNAKMGVSKQNGDIVVDGLVVAKNSWSIGRTKFAYSTDYKVGNNTYYKSNTTDVQKQDMPVIVWFNNQGKIQIAVLAACGNPMGGSVIAPSYACNQIKKTAVTGQENTYSFTTDASAASGAKVSRVVYNFGDGTAEVTAKSLTEAVTHTYSTPGTYTAKSTVYVTLPGGQEVAANGTGCATKITVAAKQEVKPVQTNAVWQCTALKATRQAGTNDLAYTFQATTSSTNATLTKVDFDYGDGTSNAGVTPDSGSTNTASSDHTYGSPGTYTAKATVYFEPAAGSNAVGKDASTTCSTTVTIKAPATPAATTPTPVAPTPPAALPATGPAGIVGLFGGASALGTLGYRLRARRRLAKVDHMVDSLRNL
jgi:hypothetical protein